MAAPPRHTLFTDAAAPTYPVRWVRGASAAVVLHAVALWLWLTFTTRIEPSPVQSLEPSGVTFVMAPVRGVGSPPPRAQPGPVESRANPLTPVKVLPLTESLVAEPPAPLLASLALAPLPPAVTSDPGATPSIGEEPGSPRDRSGIGRGGVGENSLPPAAGAPGGQSNWAGLVLGRLQQFKRYPAEAQQRREQGVCHVQFTIDRQGRVRDASLVRSTGHTRLDGEAIALVRRADPLPPPPPEVEGDIITLTVPIEFFLAR